MTPVIQRIRTDTLDIACEMSGPADGVPVILLHGWPYDPRAYDAMVAPLAAAGCRAIVPYLRGFGGTRFLSPATPRSGQQAALGHDLIALMDALALDRAALVGYDWGGRAACIVAALWPERVRCLVTGNGYNVQDIARSGVPASPEQEHRFWYQYYFHTERGRAGLAANRRAFCRLIWRLWSPQLDIRRRDLRALGFLVRQSGFRRRHHPVLPSPLRQCAWRPRARAHRAATRRKADNCGADHCAAWRGERRRAAGNLRRPRAFLLGRLSAAPDSTRRPQPAAGGSRRRDRGHARAHPGDRRQ